MNTPTTIRNRVKRLVTVPASSIQPSPSNWRTHPARQATALKGLLADLGFAGAILVRELKGGKLEAIDGHLRLETMGDALVPVLVTDLTEAEARKLIATFDPLGAMAGRDAAKLAELLGTVTTDNDAVKAMLEQVARVNGIKPVLVPADDTIPKPGSGKPRTKAGDLWTINGTHRLLVGDCTDPAAIERLMGGETADALVTDPPYSSGGAHRGDRMATVATKYQQSGTAKEYADFAGDNRDQRSWLSWCERWLSLYLHKVRPGAALCCFIDWRQLPGLTDAIQGAGWVWRGVGVWDKTEGARPVYGRYRAQCEFLVWGSAGPMKQNDGRGAYPGVIREAIKTNEKLHITAKPIAVGEWTLLMVKAGGIVLDPFAGSGTTLVAAQRTKRRAFLMEIEPRYADIIITRCEAAGLECVPSKGHASSKKTSAGRKAKTLKTDT